MQVISLIVVRIAKRRTARQNLQNKSTGKQGRNMIARQDSSTADDNKWCVMMKCVNGLEFLEISEISGFSVKFEIFCEFGLELGIWFKFGKISEFGLDFWNFCLESEFVVGLGFEFEFGVELGLESGFLLQLISVLGFCSFCLCEWQLQFLWRGKLYLWVFAVFAVNLMQQPRSA
jgi:hypothetical protein